jgi:hypothetical protein
MCGQRAALDVQVFIPPCTLLAGARETRPKPKTPRRIITGVLAGIVLFALLTQAGRYTIACRYRLTQLLHRNMLRSYAFLLLAFAEMPVTVLLSWNLPVSFGGYRAALPALPGDPQFHPSAAVSKDGNVRAGSCILSKNGASSFQSLFLIARCLN